jgi:DNA-binding response OmpR family regulator
MRVLLIEDSRRLQAALASGLRKAGFSVDVAGDGERGLYLLGINEYDVAVLDLMLPGIDGLTVLQQMRQQGKDIHVLILTARHTLEDRVKGLQAGGDDYLVKPFAFDELLARVQALVRRRYRTKNPVIKVGSLQVNISEKSVKREDRNISLAPREYMVLEYLAVRHGQLVTRGEMEEHIYDERVSPKSNVVDAVICNLRKKINLEDQPNLIHTRRGLGYVLKEEPE